MSPASLARPVVSDQTCLLGVTPRPALAQHQPGDKESIWTLARTRELMEAASEYRAPERAKVQLSSKSSARAPRCDDWSYHKSQQSLDLKLQLKL